jgi:hypothetical protein
MKRPTKMRIWHASLIRKRTEHLGRVEEAKAAAQAVLECQPSFTIHGTSLIVALEPAVFRPFADAWRQVGLPE